jgi:hypothetical protein
MNAIIFDLLESIMLSRALFTAAELNLAEHLEHGPQKTSNLAQITQTDAPTLERLLKYLSLKKIFTHNTNGTFSLPQSSAPMLGHHPETVKPFLVHDDETRWNSYGHLTYSIKTGKPSFDMLYSKDYFSSLKQAPELSQRFDDAMNIISRSEDVSIAKQLKLYGRVADIGGGNGQLLSEILSHQHDVSTAVLFDLPTVVEHVASKPNFEKIGGSFFEPLSCDADIFILKRVLHDWNDEQSTSILRNVVAAMKPQDSLWIIDGIIDKAQEPTILAAIDLALLAIFGGKERTFASIAKLVSDAGLKIVQETSLTPILSGIRCQKA